LAWGGAFWLYAPQLVSVVFLNLENEMGWRIAAQGLL
jgi:hypothetical protein